MTNQCEWVRENLASFQDGEAGAAEESRIEAHLTDCAGCREEAQALEAAWTQYKEAHPLQPGPYELSATFEAGPLEPPIPLRPAALAWGTLALAGSLGMLVVFGVGLLRVEQRPLEAGSMLVHLRDPRSVELTLTTQRPSADMLVSMQGLR